MNETEIEQTIEMHRDDRRTRILAAFDAMSRINADDRVLVRDFLKAKAVDQGRLAQFIGAYVVGLRACMRECHLPAPAKQPLTQKQLAPKRKRNG